MKSKAFVLVSVALVLVLCGWLYSRQGVLRFSSIEIDSSNSEELNLAVKRKIAQYLGANLLTISLSDLQKDLEQDPRIKKIFIRRKLPSTLSLKITPRMAIANISKDSNTEIIGDEGAIIDGYLTKESLPSWIGYEKCDLLCRQKISQLLVYIRSKNTGHFGKIAKLEWIMNRGLVFDIRPHQDASESVQVEMGTDDFLSKWNRVKLVIDLISEQQIHGERLMALGDGQIVISGVKNLHNLKNELNLKEMVRRATQQGDTRAQAR